MRLNLLRRFFQVGAPGGIWEKLTGLRSHDLLRRATAAIEMNRHLAVLPLLLASYYLHLGASFALATTKSSTCKFKHPRNNPAAYYSPGEFETRRPTAATAASSPWGHQPSPCNARQRLQVLSMTATKTEVGDVAFEPEISPGRALAQHEPRVQAFEAWAARTGCKGDNSNLLHADFEGLRGLVTEGAVKPWQAVATVPASLLLEEFDSAAMAVASTSLPPPGPISPEAWQRCPWWVRLGVRLLIENNAGEESRFSEYIGILPSQGATGVPINWSTEQLDRLHYPRLLSQIKLQRRLFNGAFEREFDLEKRVSVLSQKLLQPTLLVV